MSESKTVGHKTSSYIWHPDLSNSAQNSLQLSSISKSSSSNHVSGRFSIRTGISILISAHTNVVKTSNRINNFFILALLTKQRQAAYWM